MGLTKEYLRYIPAGNFNLVASRDCNIVFVILNGQEGRYVAVGACEHVIIYDLRFGEKAQILSGEESPASFICASPDKQNIAVGYTDGSIQIFDLESGEVVCKFSGHKTKVTTLVYDYQGHQLVSGSKDTNVIVWDTVAMTGLCRLAGHRGPITQVAVMTNHSIVISASEDKCIKFWDIEAKHCFKTIVGPTKVYSLRLVKNDTYLVTGSESDHLKVYKLTEREVDKSKDDPGTEDLVPQFEVTGLETHDDPSYPLQCHNPSVLLRSGKGYVRHMVSDATGQVVASLGDRSSSIELFYFCTDEEAKIRHKKRTKRLMKKKLSQENAMEIDENENEDPEEDKNFVFGISDEVKRLTIIDSPQAKACDLVIGSGGELRIAVVFSNNTIALYRLEYQNKEAQPNILRSITTTGHHTEIKAMDFSSDNLALVTASADSVKMWNRQTFSCLRTVKTDRVLSVIFAPGDRHVLAGLIDGRLLIIDISTEEILEEIPAHQGKLNSLCLLPDLRGCVSGGEDATVKFWQFELVVDEQSESKSKVLSLLHKRNLKLEETVICIKISPDGKFIAVSTLDKTVKLFFMDTLTFCRSLYGHAMVVDCMDISSDSTLIATGSKDKTVKIWGMDYGDIRFRILAHDGQVTGLSFVPKTHYFFTCGLDGKVKEWDGDSGNKVITLQGHAGTSSDLSVCPSGQFVVSYGSDRVLRMYEKSDIMVVLEDEEESEREKNAFATGEETIVPGSAELNLPSRKTFDSERGCENLMECLDICNDLKEELNDYKMRGMSKPPTTFHPLMQAYNVTTPHDFVLETIKRIKSNDLEQALLLLPFSYACEVLKMIPDIYSSREIDVELITKVSLFLVKVFRTQIVSAQSLRPILNVISKLGLQKMQNLKDCIGFNKYSLLLLKNNMDVHEENNLFKDNSVAVEAKQRKVERKQRKREKRALEISL